MEKKSYANTNHKTSVVAVLMPDKTAFRAQNTAGDEEKCFVMIKGSIHGEDVIILDVYATNMSYLSIYEGLILPSMPCGYCNTWLFKCLV